MTPERICADMGGCIDSESHERETGSEDSHIWPVAGDLVSAPDSASLLL
jgi:hypothetical protein